MLEDPIKALLMDAKILEEKHFLKYVFFTFPNILIQ